MENLFGKAVGELRSATRSAFETARQVGGQSIDPDVRVYQQLNEDDFRRLAQDFGMDEVAAYIKEMEFRRLSAK